MYEVSKGNSYKRRDINVPQCESCICDAPQGMVDEVIFSLRNTQSTSCTLINELLRTYHVHHGQSIISLKGDKYEKSPVEYILILALFWFLFQMIDANFCDLLQPLLLIFKKTII